MNTDALRRAVADLDITGADLEMLLVTAPTPQSRKRVTRFVPINLELGTALRDSCSRTLEDLRARHFRDWDPRGNPTLDEAVFAEGSVVSETAEILEQLRQLDAEPIGAHAIEQGKVKLYAVAFGTGEARTYFIQRRIETIVGGGKLLTRFIGDEMRLISEPALVLPTSFEALIHPLGVVMLRGDIFDRLLRDGRDVDNEVTGYLNSFAERVPLGDSSREALRDLARRHKYIRRRVRSIVDNPGFSSLSADRIRESCITTGIPENVFFAGTDLQISLENGDRFVKFLNDEVYRGTFSNELLAADGTAPF